jgi:hypothetical protein
MFPSNADRRLTFSVAKELCKANGLNVNDAHPAYGFLRLETPIRENQNQYQFGLIENVNYNGVPQNATEQRLQLQNNFVVGSKGYFLQVFNKVTGKPSSRLLTYIGLYNMPAGGELHNINTMRTNPSSRPTFVRELNQEFWLSSWMRYEMDYKVIIPKYDLLQHFYVPRTQQLFQTVNAGGDLTDPVTIADSLQYPTTQDQMDGLSDGFMPMEPNIVLSGAKATNISLNVPTAPSFDDLGWTFDPAAYEIRFVVMYRGILLQNTTSVK